MKKRFLLFILMFIITLLANFVLLNESSLFFSLVPKVKLIDSLKKDEYYKIRYTPETIDHRIIRVSGDKADKLVEIFNNKLLNDDKGKVYYNGNNYINELFKSNTQDLKLLTSDTLTDQIYGDINSVDDTVYFDFDDLLLKDFTNETLEEFREEANKLDFDITLISVFNELEIDRDYYINNLIFALVVVFISITFNIIIILWIVKRTIIINKQVIYLLRVVGLNCKRIRNSFIIILIIPILLGSLVALILNSINFKDLSSTIQFSTYSNTITNTQLIIYTSLIQLTYIMVMLLVISIATKISIKGELLR
ncbi:MAG: hypothetical protein ACRCTA_01120 [Bacilli bacterium]